MIQRERCTYTVEPARDERCTNYARWHVFYQVGTGRMVVQEPLRRCDVHLGEAVSYLSPGSYEAGWLDRIEQVPE